MVPRAVQLGVVHISGDGLDAAFANPLHMLVTFGAKDALTRPEMSRRILALNPGARLSIYQQAGHAPFYEDAGRFNDELASFTASI